MIRDLGKPKHVHALDQERVTDLYMLTLSMHQMLDRVIHAEAVLDDINELQQVRDEKTS